MKKSRFFLLISCIVASILLVFSYLKYVSSVKVDEYVKLEIKGVVDKVQGHTRGFPKVVIKGKNIILLGPTEVRKYIAIGDSIVKLSGTKNLTTYRRRKNNIEVIYWEYILENGYNQVKITKRLSAIDSRNNHL